MRLLTLVVMLIGAVGGITRGDEAPVASASLEERLLTALVDERPKLFAAWVEELERLPPEKRAELPLRVHGDALELHFAGEYSGEESIASFLEYLVSSRDKSYESMLVVEGKELERLAPLAKYLTKQKDLASAFRFQLAFIRDGRPRLEDLREIISASSKSEQQEFLRQLEVLPAGLGGSMNIKASPARLPQQKSPATAVITIPLPPAFREALK